MHKEIMFIIFKCKRFIYSSYIHIVLIGILVPKIALEDNVCMYIHIYFRI